MKIQFCNTNGTFGFAKYSVMHLLRGSFACAKPSGSSTDFPRLTNFGRVFSNQ